MIDLRSLNLALIVLSCLIGFACTGGERDNLQRNEPDAKEFGNVRANFAVKLPSFELFKRMHHKHYHSVMEELIRMKQFFGRAHGVFITSVKYFHRSMSYYKSLNDRSDVLESELEASRNKLLATGSEFRDNLLGGPPRRQGRKVERKSSAQQQVSKQTKCNENVLNHKRRSWWKRNYHLEEGFRPLSVMRATEGERRSYAHLPVKGLHKTESLLTMIARYFLGENWRPKSKKDETEQATKVNDDDVVWVDHWSGCLQPRGHQHNCGSCYAFATVACLEWAHCNERGESLKLSEQYLLDCGPMFSDRLTGCEGGDAFHVAEFFMNLGLEFGQNYPYTKSSNGCPYYHKAEIQSMGYMRVELMSEATEVPLSLLEDHTALLIGHGREDGEEYWLIRNSFGRIWGENGHMKLNKNGNCLKPAEGLIYATGNGKDVKRNERVKEPMVTIKKLLIGYGL